MVTEASSKKPRPELVTLNGALKLAEKWVSDMTKSDADNAIPVQLEGRPLWLGLGATVPRHSQVIGPSSDPLERKLHAKIEAGKRKAAKTNEECNPYVKDGGVEEDDDEDAESRTAVFSKKRVLSPLNSGPQGKKKRK